MSSYELDNYFPMQGICYHCGRDLRTHTLEKICERFGVGESIDSLATDYKVPPTAIEFVISQNSVKPNGRTIAPIVRSMSA